MASIQRRVGTKNWHAFFTDADGRRRLRSTGETDKRKAQRTADDYESAARQKRTIAQQLKVMADLHYERTGERVGEGTFDGYRAQWLAEIAKTTTPSTAAKYTTATKSFGDFIGAASAGPLDDITKTTVKGWRDSMLKKLAVSSVKLNMRILGTFFRSAMADDAATSNPVESVRRPKADKGATKRRAFTPEEIRKLLDNSTGEWAGLITFGLYTGARMGDIVRLTWDKIDGNFITFTARKTGDEMRVPIAPPLADFIAEHLPAGDDPSAPLFPDSLALIKRNKLESVAPLSGQFHDLLADVDLATRRKDHRKSEGKAGKAGKRELSSVSFHSLRHSTASLLKEAGVPHSIAQAILGHSSEAVSKLYTHTGDEAAAEAVSKLPNVMEGAK